VGRTEGAVGRRSVKCRSIMIVGAVFLCSPAYSLPANTVVIPPLPEISRSDVERPETPNIFDTVALPIRARQTSTRWLKIMRARVDEPTLVQLTQGADGLAPEETVAFVQSAMKHLSVRRSALHHCRDDGFWAPADQTLSTEKGDCIDIVVAKMEALRLLGVPRKDLYLTTGFLGDPNDVANRRETAALLVWIDGRFWMLPEHSQEVIDAGRTDLSATRFTPVFTYGVGGTWVHGKLLGRPPTR